MSTELRDPHLAALVEQIPDDLFGERRRRRVCETPLRPEAAYQPPAPASSPKLAGSKP